LGNYYRDKISAVVGLARMECTDMMKIPKLFAVRLPVGFFDLWKTALYFYFCGLPQFHIQHICKAVIA